MILKIRVISITCYTSDGNSNGNVVYFCFRVVLCVNKLVIKEHMDKVLQTNRISLDEESLRWTPLVHTNVALIDGDKENEKLPNGAERMEGDGAREMEVTGENDSAKTKHEFVNGVVNIDGDSADEEEQILRPRKRRRSMALFESGLSEESNASKQGAEERRRILNGMSNFGFILYSD